MEELTRFSDGGMIRKLEVIEFIQIKL